MARDRTARTRVRELLTSTGPVTDPSGYASGALKDAVGYQGSAVAFIQLIASMERDGEIAREIRGKRTYRISATSSTVASQTSHTAVSVTARTPSPALVTVPDLPPLQFDYDELARALVRELLSLVRGSAGSASAAKPTADEAVRAERVAYTRRLDAARLELDDLLVGIERLSAERVS